jgi:hypothetical protein
MHHETLDSIRRSPIPQSLSVCRNHASRRWLLSEKSPASRRLEPSRSTWSGRGEAHVFIIILVLGIEKGSLGWRESGRSLCAVTAGISGHAVASILHPCRQVRCKHKGELAHHLNPTLHLPVVGRSIPYLTAVHRRRTRLPASLR